jgi:hypothetical protein
MLSYRKGMSSMPIGKIILRLTRMSLFIAVAALGANALKAQSVDAGRRPPVLRGTDSAITQPRDRINSTENRSANAATATLVMIPTVVMDRNGRYVANLRKEDFRVYDDGLEQQVAYFAPIEKPFTVALMLDVSGSTKYQMDQICRAADTFISHLRNNDRLMAITFDGKISLLSDVAEVRALRQAKLHIPVGTDGHGTLRRRRLCFETDGRDSRTQSDRADD